jgi:hypothetical protein
MYTPKAVNLLRRGSEENGYSVTFDVVFNVAENAPKNLLSFVRVSLCSDNEVFAMEISEWNAPHKHLPKEEYPYTGMSTHLVVTRPSEEYMLVTIPLVELVKIDRVIVDVEEIIRG